MSLSRRQLELVGLVAAITALTIWGLTDVRRRGYPHPDNPVSHRTDLTVFTEAGAAFFDGRPPYEVTNQRGWRYVYPPLFAILMAPLHALAMPDQVVVWFFISVLAFWGSACECRRLVETVCQQDQDLAARCRRWLPLFAVLALVAALFPTFNCMQRGQVGIVKLYLLLLGLRLIVRGRTYRAWLGGGIVLALPVTIKIIPVLPVVFLLFLQLVAALKRQPSGAAPSATARRQLVGTSLGLAFGLLLCLVVVPGSLIGFRANMEHLATWSRLVLPRSEITVDDGLGDPDEHTGRNQSLANAAYRLGNYLSYRFAGGPDDRLADALERPPMVMDSELAKWSLLGLRWLMLLALLYCGLRLATDGDKLGQALGFGLGCVAMLVVSPISRGHYFMCLAPAALLLPLWLFRQGMPRAAAVMSVVPAVLSLSHYAFLGPSGRLGLLGLGTACWLMAATVLVHRGARQAAVRGSSDTAPTARPMVAADRAA